MPLKAKRKSGARLNVTLNRYIQISIAINFYLQIVTLSLLSFFLLVKEAQKKKGPKKKDAERGISLVATSDKGYAPLDLRRLAGGGLSLGAVRT